MRRHTRGAAELLVAMLSSLRTQLSQHIVRLSQDGRSSNNKVMRSHGGTLEG
jgi:hypothetical protein